jgi:hypothetical protein
MHATTTSIHTATTANDRNLTDTVQNSKLWLSYHEMECNFSFGLGLSESGA